MCAAAERDADVAGKGADIGTLGAADAQVDFRIIKVAAREFYAVDAQRLGLQFGLLAFAGEVVGALAVDLAGGEHGRHLHDVARELLGEHAAYLFLRDMICGKSMVDGVLEVETGRGGAEFQRGFVGLRAALQLLDEFCGAAGADYHHARSQRVERAGMSHFNLASLHAPREQPAHFGNQLKRRHAVGLVEAKDLSA